MRWPATVLLLTAMPAAAVSLTGVNLAGGEFGGPRSVYGKGYIYPAVDQMRAFRDLGMNVFRVPLRWERLQPVLNGSLDPAELARLDKVVTTATSLGASVIIDVHNYGLYARQPLGSPGLPPTALRDLWQRLARHYLNQPKVIFGLMNEPVKIGASEWAAVAQDVVTGIRAAGATNLILVPGSNWSGAHSWAKPIDGISNATALASLRDPAHNLAFDFHQYFDSDSAGGSDTCVPPEAAEQRVAVATAWLHTTHNRGMLTEFGISRQLGCAAVLRTVLRHLDTHDEWLGWTIWASSAWFGTYKFNLYPFQSPPPPQLEELRPFLAGAATR